MGFFLEAIQRAVGAEPELKPEAAAAAPLAPPATPAAQRAVAATVGGAAVPVTPAARAAAAAEVAAARVIRCDLDNLKPANIYDLTKVPEMLVAVMPQPVITENLLAMEQCRVLRTRIVQMSNTRKLNTILITSAVASEGKTMTSVNLAFTLSQLDGKRVLLIDCDLRNPSVARFLNINVRKGMGDLLNEAASPDEVAWMLTPSLTVLPTIPVTKNPAELLHSKVMTTVLESARKNFDFVIVDSAPLFPIADTQALIPHVDGAMMVVRAHQTPFELVKRGAEVLGGKALGTVLNGANRAPHKGYYSAYYGRYAAK